VQARGALPGGTRVVRRTPCRTARAPARLTGSIRTARAPGTRSFLFALYGGLSEEGWSGKKMVVGSDGVGAGRFRRSRSNGVFQPELYRTVRSPGSAVFRSGTLRQARLVGRRDRVEVRGGVLAGRGKSRGNVSPRGPGGWGIGGERSADRRGTWPRSSRARTGRRGGVWCISRNGQGPTCAAGEVGVSFVGPFPSPSNQNARAGWVLEHSRDFFF